MSLAGILASKGAAITFTKQRATGYDSASDTAAAPPTTVTVTGRAMGIGGPEVKRLDTLVELATVRLAFQPATAGEVPDQGATCTWGGETWSVQSTEPVAMNGSAVGAFVVIER